MNGAQAEIKRLHKLLRDARADLKEGIDAMSAFEQYCKTYQNHDISPRLKIWREMVHSSHMID